MLISEGYREQNAQLHATGDFGKKAPVYFPLLRDLIDAMNPKSIIDYGSGTHRWIEEEFGRTSRPVHSYDPCVEGLTERPPVSDLLVSIDVLEHIEPEYLDAVLDDMRSLTKRGAFLTVAIKPAKKTLPDGRNAHLIVQPTTWWLPKLMSRWELLRFSAFQNDFLAIMGT